MLRFREMDIKIPIVLALETSLGVAFAMIGIRENHVACFELSVGYIFVHPNHSRRICNDDTCYCDDLLTSRESSIFVPILLPSVIDRNDFMSCPLAVRAAFKRAGVPTK